MAGGAEHFLEEPARFASAFELRGAEGFPTAVEAWLLAEDGVEQGNGVIEVVALDGGDTFLVLLAQRARNGLQILLGHGKKHSEMAAECHSKVWGGKITCWDSSFLQSLE
jgi:hypothetical protein